MNRELSTLHRESLEIMLKVPLNAEIQRDLNTGINIQDLGWNLMN